MQRNHLSREQREQLLRHYIGQPAITSSKTTVAKKAQLKGVSVDEYLAHHVPDHKIGALSLWALISLKSSMIHPLLSPLSRITLEHAVEVMKLCEGYWKGTDYLIRYKTTSDGMPFAQLYCLGGLSSEEEIIIANFCDDDHSAVKVYRGNDYFRCHSRAFQYLTQMGYALPLFVAPGHPDNGKTAIGMGFAFDKTKMKQYAGQAIEAGSDR